MNGVFAGPDELAFHDATPSSANHDRVADVRTSSGSSRDGLSNFSREQHLPFGDFVVLGSFIEIGRFTFPVPPTSPGGFCLSKTSS